MSIDQNAGTRPRANNTALQALSKTVTRKGRDVEQGCGFGSADYNVPMHSELVVRLARILALAPISVSTLHAQGNQRMPMRWSWQETYAEIDPKGDLKWNPRPFVFERG